MGKKKERALGSVLINDHRKSHKRHDPKKDSWLHTTEMEDSPYPGYDAKLDKLKSCTEQSNLLEFLSTAELAGQDFTSERNANLKVVDPKRSGLLSRDILEQRKKVQEDKKHFLRIPRRPAWDASTTPEELELAERTSFVEWRRTLAALQADDENIICTPFEKNLELWRQLWRVVERSDVLVQIVDARNPLLFYCPDLEAYVREVDPSKACVVLMNKSDLLTEKQRRSWADYFNERRMKVVFWSALAEAERIEGRDEEGEGEGKVEEDRVDGEELYEERDSEEDDDDDDDDDEDGDDDDDDWETEDEEEVDTTSTSPSSQTPHPSSSQKLSCLPARSSLDFVVNDGVGAGVAALELNNDDPNVKSRNSPSKERLGGVGGGGETRSGTTSSNGDLVDADRLLGFFAATYAGETTKMEGVTTIGLVGYPNVGKSSTINSIIQSKKVAVSATPGKTKHFQTIYLDSSTLLCDCPGLVFPSFVTSKEELILNGILPVDQLRDYTAPVNLMCDRVARGKLESLYGIRIPLPPEGEEGRPPNAEEFLSSYGLMRGYMTSQGRPDCARSARVVLKDHVNGKLLFCHPPPGMELAEFACNEKEEDDDDDVEVVEEDDDAATATTDTSYFGDDELGNSNNQPLKNVHLHKNNKNKRKTRTTVETDRIDRDFFDDGRVGFATRGKLQAPGGGVGGAAGEQKEEEGGKSYKKHNNRNKKEKLRRVFGYMDQ